MVRWAAVRVGHSDLVGAAAPPGVDARRFALALLEDVVEVLSGLAGVRAALAVVEGDPAWKSSAEGVLWPGTPVLEVAGRDTQADVAVLVGLAELGAEEAAVVTPDAPDLPQLLLAKLYSGLAGGQAAVCPAEGGGLVALACRLPLPDWLAHADVGLDTPEALERLRAAAPDRRALVVGPGWRRLRRPTDIAGLDPGLEGWPSTRALLSGRAS